MSKRLSILLSTLLMFLFYGCPQYMVEQVEKLLPPPGYKPRYMTSSVPFDTLSKRYAEAVKRGQIDTTAMYDDAALPSPDSTSTRAALAQRGGSIDTSAMLKQVDSMRAQAKRQRAANASSADSLIRSMKIPPVTVQVRSLSDKEYPDRIDIRTSVQDSSGRVILGLAPPYFKGSGSYRNYWRTLSDSCSGARSRIDSFTVTEVRESTKDPYALAFVIDHSGSMGAERIRRLREAVRKTMNIIAAGDMVSVLPFAGSVGVDVSLTADSAVYKSIFDIEHHAKIRGGTAIHDAVIDAAREVSKAPSTHKRAVLLFTDGEDNSSKKSLTDACRTARDSGVAVYSIAYGVTNEGPLEALSRLSGGRFYRIYSTKEFPYVFADIYHSLKNYYRIAYKPPPCKGLHHVEFTVSLPELGVKRLTGHAMYDKSLFTELDTVGSVTFVNVEFESGKAVVEPHSLPMLEQVAMTLQSHPSISMEIRGHTDDRGNDALNMRLSKQRADAVADLLAGMGVDRARLTTKGFGSTRPLVANDTDENRARNRRTEFVIVSK